MSGIAGLWHLDGSPVERRDLDRVANAMHNVSLWESVADAEQMATFRPMLDLAPEFVALGVRFQRPILNFETLWSLKDG